ncbi:MAG: hypothetical protein ACO3RV_08635 [Luteolibacter sp.]
MSIHGHYRIIPILSVLALCSQLLSCSFFQANKRDSASTASPNKDRSTALNALKQTPLARLMPAAGLKVVSVREDALQQMQSGPERALAFRQSQRQKLLLDSEILDLEFPPEPALDDWLDGGLLPPKDP